MGSLVGLLLGLGLLSIWTARDPGRPRKRATPSLLARLADTIVRSGVQGVTPARLIVASAGLGLAVAMSVLAVSHVLTIAIAFGLLSTCAPTNLLRSLCRRRGRERRESWPEAVDNLASAVRAGLSLPDALARIGERGPASLRDPFTTFGANYQVSGRFPECLDRLKAELADPTGDRVVESVRLAREVGGTDLGRLLRTLAAFLREEARVRAELESRQTWAINAARLAVAAPWIVLGLLSLRPEAVAAYNSAAGLVVLACGGAVSVLAYRLMLRLGRLSEDERVLR
jgi:tight adherence protein B